MFKLLPSFQTSSNNLSITRQVFFIFLVDFYIAFMNPLLEHDISLYPFIVARICKILIIQQSLHNFTWLHEIRGTFGVKHT